MLKSVSIVTTSVSTLNDLNDECLPNGCMYTYTELSYLLYNRLYASSRRSMDINRGIFTNRIQQIINKNLRRRCV